MPFGWAAEVLKAQAVVARSYALAVRKSGPFDLYPDTRSQVYLGIGHERPSTNAAVDATAGQVVLYAGPFAAARLARALHVVGPLTDAQTTLNGSGRVADVLLSGAAGDSSLSGADVR